MDSTSFFAASGRAATASSSHGGAERTMPATSCLAVSALLLREVATLALAARPMGPEASTAARAAGVTSRESLRVTRPSTAAAVRTCDRASAAPRRYSAPGSLSSRASRATTTSSPAPAEAKMDSTSELAPPSLCSASRR
jgi:hypothetical protein